ARGTRQPARRGDPVLRRVPAEGSGRVRGEDRSGARRGVPRPRPELTMAHRWIGRRTALVGGSTAVPAGGGGGVPRGRATPCGERASVEALDLGPDDVVLDVGCGTGAASRIAASTVRSVVGVDLSERMIEQAVGSAAGLENVRFERADAEALPFADGTFTAVLC